MACAVRRLGSDDEAVLRTLAREDADFDLEGRGAARVPLTTAAARAYLADPSVLAWVAEAEGRVVGFLCCQVVRKRAGDERELLLYEIGVRTSQRRQQIGRALVDVMHAWMDAEAVREVWVLADNAGAVAFYRACGFDVSQPAPVYLVGARPIEALPDDLG